jgi:hypothetical protein
MPVLINADSGLAENLPQEAADQALSAGSHEIPLYDQENNLISTTPSDAPKLLEQGYRQLSPEELTDQLKTAQYSTTGEKIKGGAEALARGVAGPAATGAERAFGVSPEAMRYREKALGIAAPILEGAGFVGSALSGVGEAKILEELGAGAKALTGLGGEGAGLLSHAAAGAAKLGVENALLAAGDEGSKYLMQDPNQSAESAFTNIGLAGALGAGAGGVIGSVSPLWKMTAGPKVSQMIEDFSNRLKYRSETPDLVGSIAGQLSDFHSSLKNLNSSVWGSSGLKSKAASELLPEMNGKILAQAEGLQSKLEDAINGMKSEPGKYSASQIGTLESELQNIRSAAAIEKDPVSLQVTKEPTSNQLFDQINKTKQQLQELSDYDHFAAPSDRPFIGKVKDLSSAFKESLQNPEVWGEAADVQKDLNKAASKYFNISKNFETRFGSLVGKDRVIDPGKISTFVNQLPKESSSIKKSVLGEYINAGKQYQEAVNGVFGKLGLESPHVAVPLDHVENTLGKVSLGQKAADYVYNKGVSNLLGEGLGTATGAGIGALLGHPGIGAIVGERALSPFFSSVLPAITKPLMEKAANSESLKAVGNIGVAALKGQQAIGRASKALFMEGSKAFSEHQGMSSSDRSKLKSKLEEIERDPSSLMNIGGHAGYYAPDHAASLSATAVRAAQYLNSVKPKEKQNSPLDKPIKPSEAEERIYNRTLDIAQDPILSIKALKDGTLTSSDVNTVKTIYPSWYKNASQQIFNEMAKHVSSGQQIDMKLKTGLSLFMGQPMDSNLIPQVISSNQVVLNAPSLSQNAMPKTGRKTASLTGMRNIELDQRVETRTQKDDGA